MSVDTLHIICFTLAWLITGVNTEIEIPQIFSPCIIQCIIAKY